MWPDSPFAPSVGSFKLPVPVPGADPDATPTLTLSINCNWLPYIRAALMQLTLQATWDTDDAAIRLLAQQQAMTLISMFTECSEGAPFACTFDFPSDGAAPWDHNDYGSNFSPNLLSGFSLGLGFQQEQFTYLPTPSKAYAWAACQWSFSPSVLTQVVMEYSLLKGDLSGDAGSQNTGIYIFNGGTQVASQTVNCTTDLDAPHKTIIWSGHVTADKILLQVKTEDTSGTPNPGAATIKAASVFGLGSTPC